MIRRNNLDGHELRMRIRPGECLPLRFKKAVDDERIPFGSGPARAASRFATDHSATGVDCREDTIGQEDFAAIRNPAWIDCTLSHAQAHTGGAFVPPRI